MKIVIVDYGSGNLRSVQKGFEKGGHSAIISSSPELVANATHLVVPGVGAFSECMKNLERLHLLKPIRAAILGGKPYLGICLGLQILFTAGEEFGSCPGMDIMPGKVVRLPNTVKVPHIGWNQIHIEKETPVFSGISQNEHFYFVHSYYGIPNEKSDIAATTEYGVSFTSVIARDNIFACQFHPEKSQAMGLRILSNFAKQEQTTP
ncbi:MAG: imidazole glycerol phosphate synthase subunit HisH [Nitrospirae bacterium]|nr:imidazole glycerol phosphate synthase subunit HisH [Candidatus Troglogloeales bacterium]